MAAARHVGSLDLVVTSALARAKRTGELLAGDAPKQIEAGLGEYDVGEWSGLTRDQIGCRWPLELAAFDRGELEAPPGGERRVSFEQRVAAAAARVTAAAVKARAARVLVVTHGGVIRALCRLAGRPDAPVEHLCGFLAVGSPSGLALTRPVCLAHPAVGVTPPGHVERRRESLPVDDM